MKVIPWAAMAVWMMASLAGAQATMPAGGGGAGGASGADASSLDPQARSVLETLHDRRNTLKDFTAKIDYSVRHPVTEDVSGKRGTVNFVMDPAKGPEFTVDFTMNTDESGKPRRAYHQQIIFDGVDVTTKDFESKEYMRARQLPPGASPGDAVTLKGPMTLPIGLDVNDVARNFEVKVLPGTNPDEVTLRLTPRTGSPEGGGTAGKFDFKQLDITVDKKLELPVKLVQTAKGRDGDVTTIKLTEIQTNTGTAKMEDPTPQPGWTQRQGG